MIATTWEAPMDAQTPTVLGSIATLVAATTGLYAWVVRGRNKQLDVATTWQEQMMSRLSALETELASERRRTDALEVELAAECRKTDKLSDEAMRWRTRAEVLQTQVDGLTQNLRDAQSGNVAARERIAVLEADAKRAGDDARHERDRAESLKMELNNLMRDVASGFHVPVTMPPPPTRKP